VRFRLPTTARSGKLRRLSALTLAAAMAVPTYVLSTSVAATPAAADTTSVVTDRSVATPTSWQWYTNATETFINNHTATTGTRVAELKLVSTSPARFSVRFVPNSGAYAAPGGWAWYFGKTQAQVNSLVSSFSGRIVHLDGYNTSNGVRFAFVMVKNTGANYRQWYWRWNSSDSAIYNEMKNAAYRPVDVGGFKVGNTKFYTLVTVRNTGADAKSWYWLTNRSSGNINGYLTGGWRMTDLEANSSGNYDTILYNEPLGFWRWDVGFSSPGAVVEYANQIGARPISIERYGSSYAGVFLNNLSGVSVTMRNKYWNAAAKNGSWGFALKQVNGPTLAALQSGKRFEPASTLKALYHLHGMRQRQLGNVQDTTLLTYRFKNTSALPNNTNDEHKICPNSATKTAQRQWQQIDTFMMTWSDNRFTRAVTDRFGYPALRATGTTAGMTNSTLAHNIGCPSSTTHNYSTPRDINRIYEQVYEDTTYLNATHRNLFRARMLNDDNSGTENGVCTLASQQAASLGKSAAVASAFCNNVQRIAKGGSYQYSGSYPKVVSWSGGSLTTLPVKNASGVITPRHYAYTEFIDNATMKNKAQEDKVNAARTEAFLDALRPQVRAALQTW
jgi:hypothetical protein